MGHGYVAVIAYGIYVDVWKLAERLQFEVPPFPDLPDTRGMADMLEGNLLNMHVDGQDLHGYKKTYGIAFITVMGKEELLDAIYPERAELDLSSLTLNEQDKLKMKDALGDLYEVPLLRTFAYETW
jgi:hypothetical protein